MAIIYWSGPAFKSIQPAYNPIRFLCQDNGATGIPPVVYCDVYFNHFFYKTIACSSPSSISGTYTYWEFDISGIAQEYLDSKMPNITWPAVGTLYPLEEMYVTPPYLTAGTHFGATRCFVKFRTSILDVFGIMIPEAPAPVQATYDTGPLEGGGYATDNFQIVNAASQWHWQIADLEKHLDQYRRKGVFSILGWSVEIRNKVYQLSHMVSAKVYATDYAQLPILIVRDGIYSSAGAGGYYAAAWMRMAVEMYDSTGALIHVSFTASTMTLVSESIYNLPTGLKNLSLFFPAMVPFIASCHYYQVYLYDTFYTFVFCSPKYYVQQAANVQAAAHVRIWFRNYLGHLDQLNFREKEEQLKVTSSPTERNPVRRHDGQLVSLTGMGRNNVRSNESQIVTEVFGEEHMPQIKELMGTAQAYIEVENREWAYSGGTSPQPAALLQPIVIEDADYETLKYEERYEYRVSIKYSMSHENKIVRN